MKVHANFLFHLAAIRHETAEIWASYFRSRLVGERGAIRSDSAVLEAFIRTPHLMSRNQLYIIRIVASSLFPRRGHHIGRSTRARIEVPARVFVLVADIGAFDEDEAGAREDALAPARAPCLVVDGSAQELVQTYGLALGQGHRTCFGLHDGHGPPIMAPTISPSGPVPTKPGNCDTLRCRLRDYTLADGNRLARGKSACDRHDQSH